MYILEDKLGLGVRTKVPIKCFVDEEVELEETALDEAIAIAELPFAESHVALMPDIHATGYGMPVGGILATKNILVPEAVSNDIGCGVLFVQTNIPVEVLDINTGSGTVAHMITGQIMRNIPTGFSHRNPKTNPAKYRIAGLYEQYATEMRPPGGLYTIDIPEIQEAEAQSMEVVGTLGGGNHFIELQENVDDGTIGIMIHSGSRSVGAKVHQYFNNLAKELNEDWYIDQIAPEIHLPYLPRLSKEGKEYMHWMNYSLDIAELNRQVMYEIVKDELIKLLDKYTDYSDIEEKVKVNVHHNYADYENVNGENYLVHRKGAVRARSSDIIPIPGAMGSYSYLAKGLENPDSFHSAPHGAGRVLTRTAANDKYSTQEVMEHLKDNKVILGKKDKSKVADEYMLAYKDIEDVIEDSKELVKPIKKLKSRVVVKG